MNVKITREEYEEGCRNIPMLQVEAYLSMISKIPEPPHITDEAMRREIMFIIATNPICSGCLKKDGNTLKSIALCCKCKIEWYCSQKCKEEHQHIHGKYCCKIDGEWPTDSPFRPHIIEFHQN